MEQKITVRNRQSLLDLAIQAAGSVEAAFELAQANGMSLTQMLSPGDEIAVPEFEKGDRETLEYYRKYNIRPATGTGGPQQPQGIGYWAIGIDLVVV